MSDTKSTVRSRLKPINVFYVWYSELCRRFNSNPVPAVKPAKPKCQTVLDFVADRLKVEEWTPIINALRYDTSLHVISIRSRLGNCLFLHDVDTEEKARQMKRKFGTLWTAFILKSLLKSLSSSVRNTQVLTSLELDGLPMFSQYLELLLQGLKKNKTIKSLSLTHCMIKDIGCQLICAYLRFTPNIEILNLSDCGLSQESGDHLAKLIKFQQINRYCESWHNSLRYENPESANMRGIKRITLNCNPFLGDEGLDYILNELEDDLWIKALDLQKCGITENISNKVLDIIEYNKSLEIFDLRQNNHLSPTFIEKVLQVIKQKHQDSEYQWCNTALSLTWNSVQESNSKLSHFSVESSNDIYKTKSAPIRNTGGSVVTWDKVLRNAVTTNNVQLKNGFGKITSRFKSDDASSQKVVQLSNKLQEEIKKRKQIEKKNEELQHRLQVYNSDSNHSQIKSNKNFKTVTSTLQKKEPVAECQINKNGIKIKQKAVALKNGFHKNGTNKEVPNGMKNSYGNGVSSAIINNACKIFEKLMMKGKVVEDDLDEQKLLNSYVDPPKMEKNNVKIGEVVDNDMTDSQISLFKFMEELKSGAHSVPANFKNKTGSVD